MPPRPDLRTRVARLSSGQRAILAEALRTREGDVTRQLVAYVAPATDRTLDEAEITRWLRERLPAHMVPAAIVSIDTLPRLPNGKIDARALPDPARGRATVEAGFIEPRTARERMLAAIWAGVLGVDRIGVHDNFFELGGDSILSIQVVARARKAGLLLAPDQLFEHQTLAALAASATDEGTTATAPMTTVRAAPLTPIQAWLFEQRLACPQHWHQAVVLEVGEDFDSARFERALDTVRERHDALRLAFDDGQHVTDASAQSLVDAHLPGAASTEAFERIAYDLAGATTLEAGTMLHAAAVRDEDGAVGHVVLCVHHLAIDAVSWPILLEDLADAYAGGAGREPGPSFVAWADALARAAAAGHFDDDADHWATLAEDAPAIPRDSGVASTEAGVETVEAALDADTTSAVLHDIHSVHNTQVEDALVTALARTLGGWLAVPRARFGIERHGREALVDGFDLSRTIGWFTSYFPVDIRLGEGSAADDLRAVKEQLRAVPRKGASFGILRYLRTGPVADRLHAVTPPDVVFNYAGRIDAQTGDGDPWRVIDLPFASRDRSNERRHALEVNAFVRDGTLRAHWTFGRDQLQREVVERIAHAFLGELRALVAYARESDARGYTPSDFPDADLSQDELDRLFRELGG